MYPASLFSTENKPLPRWDYTGIALGEQLPSVTDGNESIGYLIAQDWLDLGIALFSRSIGYDYRVKFPTAVAFGTQN